MQWSTQPPQRPSGSVITLTALAGLFGIVAVAAWIALATGAEWIPRAVPGLSVVAAAGCVVAVARLQSRGTASERLVARLLRSGKTAVGTVHSAPGEVHEDDIDLVVGDWRIDFRDAQGASRTITTFAGFARAEAPDAGADVNVLYDPERPDDPARTFWALGADRSVGAFLRTRLGPFGER